MTTNKQLNLFYTFIATYIVLQVLLLPFVHASINLYSLFFKVLITTTLFFVLINLNKIKYNTDVYKYLASGFLFLFIKTLNSSLSEFLIQPWLLETLLMDIGQLFGFILIFYGINAWSTQNSSYSFKLKKLSETDELTNLYTRRHFNEHLTAMLDASPAEEIKFSILLINIDNFRRINEEYTQVGGDIVLKRFANKLKDYVRKTDVIGRWGGEEFIILLNNSNNIIAKQVAETIRAKTELLCIEYNQDIINFTASIGVVSYQDETKSNELIKKAQQCLFTAKKSGKNNVHLAP